MLLCWFQVCPLEVPDEEILHTELKVLSGNLSLLALIIGLWLRGCVAVRRICQALHDVSSARRLWRVARATNTQHQNRNHDQILTELSCTSRRNIGHDYS